MPYDFVYLLMLVLMLKRWTNESKYRFSIARKNNAKSEVLMGNGDIMRILLIVNDTNIS